MDPPGREQGEGAGQAGTGNQSTTEKEGAIMGWQERQKKETRDFLLNFKNRANELNNDENELNRLIEEENERQWKKRMEVWQREEVFV